jgi:hypothetical protein
MVNMRSLVLLPFAIFFRGLWNADGFLPVVRAVAGSARLARPLHAITITCYKSPNESFQVSLVDETSFNIFCGKEDVGWLVEPDPLGYRRVESFKELQNGSSYMLVRDLPAAPKPSFEYTKRLNFSSIEQLRAGCYMLFKNLMKTYLYDNEWKERAMSEVTCQLQREGKAACAIILYGPLRSGKTRALAQLTQWMAVQQSCTTIYVSFGHMSQVKDDDPKTQSAHYVSAYSLLCRVKEESLKTFGKCATKLTST